MELANQASRRFHHEYIGTEHMLLGVLEEPIGIAANEIKNLAIDPQRIQAEAERLILKGPDMIPMGKLPRTPRAQHVVELAVEEAIASQRPFVDTGDMLIGLLREIHGVAAQVLMNQGLQMEPLWDEVAKVRARQAEVDSSGRGLWGKFKSFWATRSF